MESTTTFSRVKVVHTRPTGNDNGHNYDDYNDKYVVKHKSAKLLLTYVVGKLEAALNISHLTFNIKYKQSES